MNKRTVHETSPKFSSIFKRWKDLTLAEKHREIVECAFRHRGHAVSLNMSHTFASSVSSAEDPMRRIGKRMNKNLKAADLSALPVLLLLELTRGEARPHLHGVLVTNGVPISTIQPLVRRAAGYVYGHSGSRQCNTKALYDADGWVDYISKNTRLTRKLLGLAENTQLAWVSHAMTQLARDEYEATRLGRLQAANLNNKLPARAI